MWNVSGWLISNPMFNPISREDDGADEWRKEFDKKHAESLRYIIEPKTKRDSDGWLPYGRVCLVGGASGAGKTTLVYQVIRELRRGHKVFDRETHPCEFAIVGYDRGYDDMVETCRNMRINTEELPFFDVVGAARQLSVAKMLEALKVDAQNTYGGKYRNVKLFVVEGLDMKVPNGKIGDPTVVADYLQDIEEVARKYDFAVLGVLGCPKMKPDDRYAESRDLLFGSVSWGRKSHTIFVLMPPDPTNPNGPGRKLLIMSRVKQPEIHFLKFENGRLRKASEGGIGAGQSEAEERAFQGRRYSRIRPYALQAERAVPLYRCREAGEFRGQDRSNDVE